MSVQTYHRYVHLAVNSSSSNLQSRISHIRSGDEKSTVIITQNWDITALKNYLS